MQGYVITRVGGEGLSLLGGDGRVALDERRHDTTGSFNAQGQRCDVEK